MIYLNRNKKDKRISKGEEGSITVFLSITLSVVIALTGVLLDGARIRTGNATMKRVASSALHSTLSHYDKTLKEEYGLFALALPEGNLEEFIRLYMEKGLILNSLSSSDTGFWDIYQFNIEELQASPRYSLEDDEVIRQQILEYMKYRGPKILVEEFYEKIKELSKVSETATFISKKMEIERELGELAHMEKELEEEIKRVKTFNHQEYQQEIAEMATLVEEVNPLHAEKEVLLEELQIKHKLLETVKLQDQKNVQNSIEELEKTIATIEERIAEVDGQLWQKINVINQKLGDQMDANLKVQQLATKIVGKLQSIKNKITVLEQSNSVTEESSAKNINNDLNKNSDTEDLMQELEKYKRAIEKHSIGDLVMTCEGNHQILREAIIFINQISSIIAYRRGETYTSDELNKIKRNAKEYQIKVNQYKSDLTYNKWQLELEVVGEATTVDEREKAAREANELMENKEKHQIVIPEKLQEMLPSKGIGGGYYPPPVEFDHKSKAEGYSDEALNIFSVFLGGAAAMGEGIRDEIYINEYIIDMFNSYVKKENSQRTAFFTSEVEYILYGKPPQQENINAVKRDLLMMRFVVNLLQVYNDPKLVKSAVILATTLASTIGPAAIPIIKTLILCSYAMNYSIEDVSRLLKGEAVNFYRSSNKLKLDYDDYLRFLLLRPGYSQDMKINRVKDLIQLNLQKNPIYGEGYRIGSSSAFINLEVQYSMGVLFLGKEDGRAYHKMELMQGY